MTLLQVDRLTKTYPAFTLDSVSFDVNAGEIVGFIGRNGAGKSTTLKSLMDMVHPDSGSIRFFDGGGDFRQRIGFVAGGIDYYTKTRLKAITDVTRRFYERWDEDVYRSCLDRFSLDESKTPAALSAGMKVKYALTLALSHHAELLLLDEPTSGLDPVSRDELLDIFLNLRREGVGILFSTHIITDLERCADRILYIRGGRVVESAPLADFGRAYRLIRGDGEPPAGVIGVRQEREGWSALIRSADADETAEVPSLEEIMLHLEREEL